MSGAAAGVRESGENQARRTAGGGGNGMGIRRAPYLRPAWFRARNDAVAAR